MQGPENSYLTNRCNHPPPPAGLEKTQGLKKNKPSGFFVFLVFFVFFFVFFSICPEEKVFRVFFSFKNNHPPPPARQSWANRIIQCLSDATVEQRGAPTWRHCREGWRLPLPQEGGVGPAWLPGHRTPGGRAPSRTPGPTHAAPAYLPQENSQ